MIAIDCIIVAGGSGTRLSASLPKAFVLLSDKPLFVHSLLVFDSHKAINKIVLVVPADMIDKTKEIVAGFTLQHNVEIVSGGEIRWQSVKNGIDVSETGWVMIHDSARPFVTRKIIDDVIAVSAEYDAVISAVPEVDTVRKFSGNCALDTLDRSEILRVQTPQLFKRELLCRAFDCASTLQSPPTDESMLMEHIGIPVGVAWGDPLNFKVTAPADMTIAQALCVSNNNKNEINL